ncbi:MAG: helix-turn-helix domain-containing protein [Armatimonadota bacterium]
MSLEDFGEYFKQRRLATGLTLRAFCQKYGFEPSNLSKLERGRLAPPQSEEVLRRYADALQLDEGSEERQYFFDLANACNGIIPAELLSDREVVAKLPVLYRTLRGEKITDEQFEALIKLVRRA